ncbi:dienelactone hydrolase family protein [Orrella sp. JC864]|uniref:dienelactone hydrolase family protein n=1 Tax=Orrella sp. JC864 TaxID=3120298 RepID=UPI00300B1241
MPVIQIKTRDGHSLQAYTAGSASAARGLVVLQEIFGVNAHMRQVCDTFAAQGYAVVCPALFDRVQRDVELGYEPEDIVRGRALRERIALADTLADIEAAAGALPVGAQLGVVGYCWGGTLAWQAICQTKRFAAASCWYGAGIADALNQVPHGPVQMHFGETDRSIPPSAIQAIRQAQPSVDIYVYPQAGHGFGCEARADYEPASAALAQQRTLAFFSKHLVRTGA